MSESTTRKADYIGQPVNNVADADAILIAMGVAHLAEDFYENEETGTLIYDLEDGRSVEISPTGCATILYPDNDYE
jgi:hypothetical protein